MRIFVLSLLLLTDCALLHAAAAGPDSLKAKPSTLSSLDVRVDLAGPFMEALGIGYSQYEAGVRAGFINRYFAVLEAGYGKSDYTGETTGVGSKSKAPFFRVGADYNMTKQNAHDSRFCLGLRYGFSYYKFDLTDPSYGDPVWHDYRPLALNAQSGSAHWLELVASAETRLWRFVHLGWSVRYKARVSHKACDAGSPWYVPGFGANGKRTWGASFILIFEI